MSAVAEPTALLATASPVIAQPAPLPDSSSLSTPAAQQLALDLKLAMDQAMDVKAIPFSSSETMQSVNDVHQQDKRLDPTPSTSDVAASANPDQEEDDEKLDEGEDEGPAVGEKPKFLNVGQKRKFQEWIGQHSDNLYPTRDEKLGLAKLLGATYLQVTRLLANHRRRLQLQRKRKPKNEEGKDEANTSSEKENCLDEKAEAEKLVMEHVQSIVDEVSAPTNNTALSQSLNVPTQADEETRMSHVSELHCDESFEDLDDPIENSKPAFEALHHQQPPPAPIQSSKSALSERNQRIDLTIDEVVQYVNQLKDTSVLLNQHNMNRDNSYVTPPPSAPLNELPTMNHPSQQQQQQASTSTIPASAQNIPIQATNSAAAIDLMMRRPGSSMTMNGLPSSTTTTSSNTLVDAPKCDNIPQTQSLLDHHQHHHHQQFTTLTPQQQVMNAMNSLNLGNLLPPPQQQQQQQSATNGQPPNLLPLIQKILNGEFLNGNREDKLMGMDVSQAVQRPPQMASMQQQHTGTSLALNQLIGNNSTTSSTTTANVTPAQQLSPAINSSSSSIPPQQQQPTTSDPTTTTMLYPGLQATFQALAAQMAAANNPAAAPFMPQQPQQQQPQMNQTAQTVADLIQQTLLRQQQNSILSLLQSRDPLGKLAANAAPVPSMTPDFLGVNNCVDKSYAAAMASVQQNGASHLMSPPLSSNASSSPRLFSNEPAFSDISTCSNSPAPLDSSFVTTATPQPIQQQTPPQPQQILATPPSTGKVKPEKAPRKTKKQLRLEAEQNGENVTPVVARKRPSTGKKETAKEKKLRLEAESRQAKKIVPRNMDELTENESIAVAVLAGLANGRFP